MDHEAIEDKRMAVHNVSWLDMQRRCILFGGTLTCMASALALPSHFDHKGGGNRFSRNVKNTVHSQARGGGWVGGRNRINKPLQNTNSLLAFFLDLLTLEDGTDMLPQNVGEELPLYAA